MGTKEAPTEPFQGCPGCSQCPLMVAVVKLGVEAGREQGARGAPSKQGNEGWGKFGQV